MTRFILIGNGRPLEEVYLCIQKLGGAVVAVHADPESWDRLRAMGIHPEPAAFFRNKTSAEQIRSLRVDWLLNVQSKTIFPPEVLAAPIKGAINFHPGPLPEGAGLTAHEWAILEGEKQFGSTLHYMTPELDGGPIIARRNFEIQDADTGLTLLARAWKIGIEMLCDILPDLIEGRPLNATPQDKSRHRYFRGTAPHGGVIQFEWSVTKILNLIRALNYYPLTSPSGPPHFFAGGMSFPVYKAERGKISDRARAPGTILDLSEPGATISAGGGESVTIRDLLSGRSVIPAGPHLRQNGLSPGDLCGRAEPAGSRHA